MDKKWIALGLVLVFIVGILWQEIKNRRKLRRIQEDWGSFPKKDKKDREKELYKSYIKL